MDWRLKAAAEASRASEALIEASVGDERPHVEAARQHLLAALRAIDERRGN